MSFKKEVIAKLDKLAERQEQHTVKLAENTVILNDHHVRASQLESRFKPVEKHVLIVNAVVKIALAVIAASGTVAGILHYFLK